MTERGPGAWQAREAVGVHRKTKKRDPFMDTAHPKRERQITVLDSRKERFADVKNDQMGTVRLTE